ncbi:hypothetical protein OAJ27_00985 [bacterium]|nr:hypothetical protein [bacterium]
MSIIIGLYTCISPKTAPAATKRLEKKSIILDKALISVRPILTQSGIRFNIDIETYEFPDLLTENLSEHSIVMYKNKVLPIVGWEPSSQTDHQRSGTLNVSYPSKDFSDTQDSLSLTLFFYTSHQFTWTLSQ